MERVTYHTAWACGIDVFYREAGPAGAPHVLLLHGFPSASHMFRELMPPLAEAGYHVVAPDMPGFGRTESPDRAEFAYTFEHLAQVIDAFTGAIGLDSYALYVFDYGAPVGLRMAAWHPERVWAVVSQNGNAYEEGLGKKWEARAAYWADPTPELRASNEVAFEPETVYHQYVDGTPEGSVSPDGWTLDLAYAAAGGRAWAERQDDLIYDYRTNVALYPAFQRYLREWQPPLLAVWGRNDPSFVPAGAEAFLRDVPDAEVHLLDSGHFALESHAPEIAALMVDFLGRSRPHA